MALTAFLTEVADAIREKTGETELIPAPEFAQRISEIPSSPTLVYEETSCVLYPTNPRMSIGTFSTLKNIKYVVCACAHALKTDTASRLLFASYDENGSHNMGEHESWIEVEGNEATFKAVVTPDKQVTIKFCAWGEPA